MIAREARRGDTVSVAWYSECGRYRYRLTQAWGAGPLLAAVLLNPSTATEEAGDATLTRLAARARGAGFAGLDLRNLFALRSRDPGDLRRAADPEGPANAQTLAALAGPILCGWGNAGLAAGRAFARGARAAGLRLMHLGLTGSGAPRHPLYVAASRPMEDWDG